MLNSSSRSPRAAALLLAVSAVLAPAAARAAAQETARYCRYEADGRISYGIVEGDRVREITAPPFAAFSKTRRTRPLAAVKLLPPTTPGQILALAWNYRSHFVVGQGELKAGEELPAKFRVPQPFYKSPSCLVGPGDAIVLPKDAGATHYEAEMVIVIGRRAKSVPRERALEHVLGVTCGNDVSERVWQYDEKAADVQWWRAKGADTFGPCGPFIVSGLNYDDLRLRLILNGEVKQDVRTSDMIHDVATVVSFISRYVTLNPGDLIYTGTTGATGEIREGDVVEVELEGVGTLRNVVVREK